MDTGAFVVGVAWITSWRVLVHHDRQQRRDGTRYMAARDDLLLRTSGWAITGSKSEMATRPSELVYVGPKLQERFSGRIYAETILSVIIESSTCRSLHFKEEILL
jgi:hypothetical protein